MVNRIWQTLFRRGIVSSTDNFGKTGQAPSHPELLDHLAVRFVEQGWSVKSMIRELVLSRTYRLGTAFDSANYAADPDNVCLWRATPRRLDAESVRDSMLVASGELDRNRPRGPSSRRWGRRPATPVQSRYREPGGKISFRLPPDHPGSVAGVARALRWRGSEHGHRSAGIDQRPRSGSLPHEQSGGPATGRGHGRAAGAEAGTPRERGHPLLSHPVTGLLLTEAEITSCTTFFQRFIAEAQKTMDVEKARNLAFTSFCQGLFASAEFRFLN